MAQLEGEKAVEIFQLATRGQALPEKLEKLVPLSFIGQAAVAFYRSTIKRLPDLDMSEDQRKATLSDGQDAGKMLLAIEARIGELIDKTPISPIRGESGLEGSTKKLPKGIDYHRSEKARTIARNPETVAKVIAEAEENEDIPTKTAVLNRIAYEKEKKRREAAEGKREESKALIAADQVQYLIALDKCISALPQKPPKTWNESAFAEAKAKAKIIIRRLEVFANA